MRARIGLVATIAVVLGWLAVGGLAGPYSGRLGEVASNDNASFLPANAEATRAQQRAAAFTDRDTTPAIVIYERASGITDADRTRVAADTARFADVDGVVGPLPPAIPSDDGKALQVIVPLDQSSNLDIVPAVEQLRAIATAAAGPSSPGPSSAGPPALTVHVAGPGGLLADLVAVFEAIDVTLLLATAGVVLVILLIVYRSPVLWAVPLLAAGMSFAVSAALVYLLADADIIVLNGQAQGILTVLVFGAGTDYALLLIARYREELRRFPRTVDAMRAAWRGAAPAIAASAGTVVASLLCLLLSGLNSNRALGPVSAVGIAATAVVMLSFLPAVLLLGGRWIFWPRVPTVAPVGPGLAGGPASGVAGPASGVAGPASGVAGPASGVAGPASGVAGRASGVADVADRPSLWHRVAGVVAGRARVIWVGTSVLLAALALGLTQIGATELGQSDLFTNRTDSVTGQEVISRHYPGGAGSPILVIASEDAAASVAGAARTVPGVVEVSALSVTGAPGVPGPAKVVDGRVQLQVIVDAAPDSPGAERAVRDLRTAVHAVPGADALVGGFTAVNVDTADAAERDRNVIIPLVLAVIAAILAVLLRSLLAPVLLIATVVLSFAATLGLCALLFRYVFGFPGVDASFPLFAFVFLVALGIDYNIFLMTRVREESASIGTRPGVLRGLIVTGGVITSAGVVLAATFSALAVLPLVVLVELGVAVALGVLLDTVVVRSLLVPALAYDLDRRIWWPGSLSRRTGPPGAADVPPVVSPATVAPSG